MPQKLLNLLPALTFCLSILYFGALPTYLSLGGLVVLAAVYVLSLRESRPLRLEEELKTLRERVVRISNKIGLGQ